MTTTTLSDGLALECSNFVRYPGYTGPVNVTGQIVMVDQSPSYTQDLFWQLSGVDPVCMVAAASERQCGIRVIEGTNCAQPEGNDLYSQTLSYEDPWGALAYDTDFGTSRSSNQKGQSVSTGMSLSELAGHALIVYDSVFPGEAVACCVMRTTSLLNVSWNKNSVNASNVTVITNVKPVAITRRPWWVVVVWCLAILAIVALMCFALPCCGGAGEGDEMEDSPAANPVETTKGLAKKVKAKLRRRAEEAEDQEAESRQPLTEGPEDLEEDTQRKSSRKKSGSTSCLPKVSPCAAA